MSDTSLDAGIRPAARVNGSNNDAHATVAKSANGSRGALPGVKAERAEDKAEQYEIGIGSWKATFVRESGNCGWVSYRNDLQESRSKTWARRRTKRLIERLNARRRSAD
jgi:hypothetical protein